MINGNVRGFKATAPVVKKTRSEAAITCHNHGGQVIATVSICLTGNHEECLGQYEDFSNTYFVKCGCRCHSLTQKMSNADAAAPVRS
jgi:hypothetical protein